MNPLIMSSIKYGLFIIFFVIIAFKSYEVTMKLIKKHRGEKSEFDEWLE